MRRKESAEVSRVGVAQTQLAVNDKLRWVFREQPIEDYGIDAQVEITVDGDVSGRLLALQIKSGLSWFDKPGPGGWWYSPDTNHLKYWLDHSLPVVVVFYHPETKRCHWQLVREETLTRTSTGGWKLLVPEDHVLDETARTSLREAAEDGTDGQLTGLAGRSPSRRAVVVGGLAALASAAAATPLFLSRTGHSDPRPTPVSVAANRILTNNGKVTATVFSPDGRTLASASQNGVIRLWNTTTWTTTDILHASAAARAIAYSPNGLLVSADYNSPIVTLWDSTTHRPTNLPGQINGVSSVGFSPDGRTLVTGSTGDNIETWDVPSGSHTAHIFTYSSINSIAFYRGASDIIALGCDDHTVQLWDLSAGQEIASLPNHPEKSVESVAWSRNGKTLACGSADHTVRLWNAEDYSPIALLRGHTGSVLTVAFSPDGRTLASGGADNTIRIWDLATHDTIAILRGHTFWIESVAFSPDGAVLASGSYDKTIRLWNTRQWVT